MKVSELRKILKNVPGDLDIYTADHDHDDFEVNGLVSYAMIIEYTEQNKLNSGYFSDKQPKKYFVIHT